MHLKALEQRHQGPGAGADLVGQRGKADRHAFARIALGLAIERLVLAELLEQHHGQEARPRPSAGHDMEWRWRLADGLAVPAGDLLPDMLDHLPLARDNLQRFGDVLAQLRQARAAASGAAARRRYHDTLARQMVGEGFARRPVARERSHRRCFRGSGLGREFILARVRFQLLQL